MILYGQTSSGKTFTLFGDSEEEKKMKNSVQKDPCILVSEVIKNKNEIVSNLKSDLVNLNYKDNMSECINNSESHIKTKSKNRQIKMQKMGEGTKGIIPRYLQSLFQEIDRLQTQEDAHFTFEYSFFEIYKEKIYDLIEQTYDYIDDGNGRYKRVLKALNLREKQNNNIVIGREKSFG